MLITSPNDHVIYNVVVDEVEMYIQKKHAKAALAEQRPFDIRDIASQLQPLPKVEEWNYVPLSEWA